MAAAFIAGAFVASPELRAYAAATITSADIVNETIKSEDIKNGEVKTSDLAGNAVTAAKIKDGEVTATEIATDAVGAAEIATNAVGASEIVGVNQLLFKECPITISTTAIPGNGFSTQCSVPGTEVGNVAVASVSGPPQAPAHCFAVTAVVAIADAVEVAVKNTCNISAAPGAINIAIVVFDTSKVITPPI